MNAESFSDGWNATKVDSHANIDQRASDGYSWEENIGDRILLQHARAQQKKASSMSIT